MKVAVIHDWLVVNAGAERVLECILQCYPSADIFAVVDFLEDEHRGFLQGKRATTTFVQRLPFAKTRYRNYLALMPLAIEQLDLSRYDLVISSSHAVAKGVITGPDQLHISYVHSPMRYAWDLQWEYLSQAGIERGVKSWVARCLLHRLRTWDCCSANRVDCYVTPSHFVARRVAKVYRRSAEVIHPPVNTDFYALCERKDDYYVTASRMVPYKRMGTIVRAFAAMPDRRLVVIGDGPERQRIESEAGANVTFLGYQPNAALKEHFQKARAFIFAAEEDFGIVPLEAQACGTPVIAFGKGGARESIRGLDHANPSGLFFDEQSSTAIAGAVAEFERQGDAITPLACRENALRFAKQRFRDQVTQLVESRWTAFREKLAQER